MKTLIGHLNIHVLYRFSDGQKVEIRDAKNGNAAKYQAAKKFGGMPSDYCSEYGWQKIQAKKITVPATAPESAPAQLPIVAAAFTITPYATKPAWFLLKEGEILRAAGSQAHCEGWQARILAGENLPARACRIEVPVAPVPPAPSPRDRYRPANAVEIKAGDSTASAWLGISKQGTGKIVAVGFSGKRGKPDFHYAYSTDAQARAKINEHAAEVKARETYRATQHTAQQTGKCATVSDVRAKAMRQGSISAADTAICIRTYLRGKYPGIKFSVTSENYSMGCSVRVHWTDGPAPGEISAICRSYNFAGFDGSIDLKYSMHRWLAADGSMSLAHTTGTAGSMGAHGEELGSAHHAGAVLVTGGADYVTASHDQSYPVRHALAARICQHYGATMPGEFASETAFDHWCNHTRINGAGPDFTCGWNDVRNLMHRATSGAIKL